MEILVKSTGQSKASCPNCEVADLTTPEGLGRALALLRKATPLLTINPNITPCCELAAQAAARLRDIGSDQTTMANSPTEVN